MCHSAEIHPRIFNYFKFKSIDIINRDDPNETFEQHKNELNEAMLICKPEIDYYPRDKNKSRLINYLIKPRNNDDSITKKHENLA